MCAGSTRSRMRQQPGEQGSDAGTVLAQAVNEHNHQARRQRRSPLSGSRPSSPIWWGHMARPSATSRKSQEQRHEELDEQEAEELAERRLDEVRQAQFTRPSRWRRRQRGSGARGYSGPFSAVTVELR